MEKTLQFLNLFKMLVLLPFNVSNGYKKRAYKEIKKQMMLVNLL
ncbi:hypothetical protein [Tenacibaculum insulae]